MTNQRPTDALTQPLLRIAKPQGFGFSETAFRVFVLMASRRLKSDRFFTDDYRPEIYTQLGLDHIRHNGMASILTRHYQELAESLEGVANPFTPRRTAQSGPVKSAVGGEGV